MDNMKKFISVLILLILLPWINATANTENVLYDQLVSKWIWRIHNIPCISHPKNFKLIIELCQN